MSKFSCLPVLCLQTLVDDTEVIAALDELHAQLVVDTVAEVGVDVLYLLRREIGIKQLVDAVEVFSA